MNNPSYFLNATHTLSLGKEAPKPPELWTPLHPDLSSIMWHPATKLTLDYVEARKSAGDFRGYPELAIETAWFDGFNEGVTAAHSRKVFLYQTDANYLVNLSKRVRDGKSPATDLVEALTSLLFPESSSDR